MRAIQNSCYATIFIYHSNPKIICQLQEVDSSVTKFNCKAVQFLFHCRHSIFFYIQRPGTE